MNCGLCVLQAIASDTQLADIAIPIMCETGIMPSLSELLEDEKLQDDELVRSETVLLSLNS